MRHHPKFAIAASTATTILLSTLVAGAESQAFAPAEVCVPASRDDNSVVFTNEGAAINNSFTPGDGQEITCGVGQNKASDTNDDLWIYFGDADSSWGNTAGVGCDATEMADDASTVVFRGSRYGCATNGGCTGSAPNYWTGENFIRFTDIHHGGTYFTTVACSIPDNWSYISALTIVEQ